MYNNDGLYELSDLHVDGRDFCAGRRHNWRRSHMVLGTREMVLETLRLGEQNRCLVALTDDEREELDCKLGEKADEWRFAPNRGDGVFTALLFVNGVLVDSHVATTLDDLVVAILRRNA